MGNTKCPSSAIKKDSLSIRKSILLKFNPEKRIRYKTVSTTMSTNNLLYSIDIETVIMENLRCDVISMYRDLGLITIPDAPLLICKKILNKHDETTIEVNCLY